ncbi:hypothetical protein V1478_000296 [Vespula squamosa]|uniref:Uncharacterized protein n=1 Tax=Vespula squamosa TaxID=30214 RepID=A0ABD2C5N2_VESSQ
MEITRAMASGAQNALARTERLAKDVMEFVVDSKRITLRWNISHGSFQHGVPTFREDTLKRSTIR